MEAIARIGASNFEQLSSREVRTLLKHSVGTSHLTMNTIDVNAWNETAGRKIMKD